MFEAVVSQRLENYVIIHASGLETMTGQQSLTINDWSTVIDRLWERLKLSRYDHYGRWVFPRFKNKKSYELIYLSSVFPYFLT